MVSSMEFVEGLRILRAVLPVSRREAFGGCYDVTRRCFIRVVAECSVVS